jgi:hypothetical protein
MLAQHPLTGKPIRVLKTQAQLWRDGKTLVLLKPTADHAIPWGRWETAAVGLSVTKELRSRGIEVHIPILIHEPTLTIQELVSFAESSHLIAISTNIIRAVGEPAFRAANLGNILCLEEFSQIYSYVGAAWNGSAEDAAILLCCVLHYSRVAGVSSAAVAVRAERLAAMKIEALPELARPPALWLIQQFYLPDKAKRRREINRCLAENVACPYIDKILLLNEDNFFDQYPEDPKDKIIQRVIKKRLTYEAVIRAIKDEVPPDTIAVFANSDIFLEKTTRLLWSIKLQDKFITLLRWDVPEEKGESTLFGPRDDSQDTWVIWSTSVKSRTWKWNDLNFPFGKNGCDNAINLEMLRQKFLISNPAYSIKTQHVHASGLRNYDPLDIVDKPTFIHVAPTGLNDMDAKESWATDLIFRKVQHTSFARPIASVQDKELLVFSSMIKRSDRYMYLKNSQNLFTAESNDVLQLTDCFLTHNGLPYGHHELYIGPSPRSQELWGSLGLGGCTPTIETNFAIAAPLTDRETASKEAFCMRYLTKILQLRDVDGEFLCPQKDEFVDVLRLFRWSKQEVPVLPQDPNMAIYCKRALVWACTNDEYVTKEDIAALRDALIFPWHEQKPKTKKITILEDGSLIDSAWIAELESQLDEDYSIYVIWPGRTSLERIASLLCESEVFIYATSEKGPQQWSWMWMLPVGSRCIELQNEMDPTGDAIHLAGAATIPHSLVIQRRGLREPMMKDSVKHTLATLRNEKKADEKVLPLIWIPRRDIQGFFGHAGDSFRELVAMWGERGLCEVKEHPTAVMCWWGDVGTGTLLYDRPNLDWLWNAPPLEQGWTKGLFGNPAPPTTEKGTTWSFWPRRPRLVDEIVRAGAPTTPWGERTRGLVFYGKIENAVQERRRTGKWDTICDEYIMAKKEEPHSLTAREYLERLTEAKFGLCLAGYGKKCHREVECMAMGCVPVVAADVDITGYLNPPEEGVHYIRIKDPATLKEDLSKISEEDWTRMSEAGRSWYDVNASSQGLFTLTSKAVVA